jgi:hypothetical protein
MDATRLLREASKQSMKERLALLVNGDEARAAASGKAIWRSRSVLAKSALKKGFPSIRAIIPDLARDNRPN